jgi:hypothetical protein
VERLKKQAPDGTVTVTAMKWLIKTDKIAGLLKRTRYVQEELSHIILIQLSIRVTVMHHSMDYRKAMTSE